MAQTKEILIVQSKVKDIIKKKNFQCSAEAIEAFSAVLEDTVNKAINRAKANGRKTVKAQDI